MSRTKQVSRRRKTKRKKKLSSHDKWKEEQRLIAGRLSALKVSLQDAGYQVKTINDWGTYVVTPKIDVKFVKILMEEDWTIGIQDKRTTLGNQMLNLMDMRKKPYTKPPKKYRDFNIVLKIEYAGHLEDKFTSNGFYPNSWKIKYWEIENWS